MYLAIDTCYLFIDEGLFCVKISNMHVTKLLESGVLMSMRQQNAYSLLNDYLCSFIHIVSYDNNITCIKHHRVYSNLKDSEWITLVPVLNKLGIWWESCLGHYGFSSKTLQYPTEIIYFWVYMVRGRKQEKRMASLKVSEKFILPIKLL